MEDQQKTKEQLIDELAELRRQCHKYQSIFQQSSLNSVIFSPQGQLLQVNEISGKMWDLNFDLLTDYNIFQDEQMQTNGLMPYIQRAFAGEPVVLPVTRYDPTLTGPTYAGRARWVEGFIYPVKDGEGNIEQVIVNLADVTECKLAEESLRRDRDELEQCVAERTAELSQINSRLTEQLAERNRANEQQEILQQILENIPLMIDYYDEQGNIIFINREWQHVFGWSLEDLKQRGTEDFYRSILPDEQYRRSVFKHMAKSPPGWHDLKIRHKDGSDIETSWITIPLSNGKSIGIGQDITDRNQAADAVQKSEATLRAIIESVTDHIYVKDREGRFLLVNSASARFLGKTVDEIIGKKTTDIFPPEIAHNLLSNDQKVMEEGEISYNDHELPDAAGNYYSFLIVKVPYRNKQGDVIGLIGVSRDITARKQAERALRESEERYRTLAENSYDLICEVDINLRYIYISPNYKEMLGYQPNELIGRNAFGLIHPDDRVKLSSKIGSDSAQASFRYKHKNGEWRWFESSSKLFRTASGEQQWVVISRDITERKRTEDALQKSEATLRTIIESVLDAIYIKDINGRYLLMNSAGARYLEKSVEEIIGKDDTALFPSENAQDIITNDQIIFQTGKAYLYEDIPHYSSDGKRRIYHTIKVPYLDNDGKVIGLIGISRDISERKQAEEILAAEKEQLAVTLRSIGDGVITTDTQGKVVLINRAAEAVIGMTQEEAQGRPLAEVFRIFNEKTLETCDNPVNEVLQTDNPVEITNHTVLISKDGTPRIIADSAAPIRDREGKIIGVVLVFRDITERRKIEERLLREQAERAAARLAEAELEKANLQLQALSTHILKAQEEERIRLARELHDELGQALTSIKLALELAIATLPAADPYKIKKSLSDLCTYVETTAKDVQRVARDLRPSVLDDFGLAAALESYGDAYSKRTGIKVSLSLDRLSQPLAKETETALYRIVQEALTNAAKHSAAKAISIDLIEQQKEIILTVLDDGKGCNLVRVPSNQSSFGLLGMAERARMIGARLSMKSRPGEGFYLQVTLPMDSVSV